VNKICLIQILFLYLYKLLSMNVKDLLNRETPFKIKLNNKFTLEESFDPGTILLVKTIKEDETFDDGTVYKLWVSALKEDEEHNVSVAIHDWLDSNSRASLNIYEANKNMLDSKGNYNDTIYVMDFDECFDEVVEEDDSITHKEYRFESNPKEREMVDKFLEHSDMMEIERRIFGTDPNRSDLYPNGELSKREMKIVLSTIQWLGSPVGQGFLDNCGFIPKINKK
jgi:hypothetical protein